MKPLMKFCFIVNLILFSFLYENLYSQSVPDHNLIDQRIKKFLESRSGKWGDMNIPEVDGKVLYNLIIENNFKSALEIGTSTGHSGIWIAWALSKTGGKLITVDIDERRHRQAVANFREAGLIDYIDARLADAHVLVPELQGPFDFVFSDADKDWYKNYFIAVDPKLKPGGIYVSHNVYSRDRTGSGWMSSYVAYLLSLKNYTTTFNDAGGGMSISKKNVK